MSTDTQCQSQWWVQGLVSDFPGFLGGWGITSTDALQ